ncbi:type II toxin-antitoxin system CcdA family antitoxin [Natrinema versiforme]|uniref:Uncharacterized protein n=1 Tax=Natrinema versiforme JCM 10478 TaxID=1227496 RepID=L9Y8D9_9EURY|nr:type II toxin-antitoxin system CcdA family antitoxin [Natrinema versiforme]ELY69952.1 hypothetical protein C489_03356 [Natrinema versiforme JCM 10478]
MSEKKRTGISIDAHVLDQLKARNVNVSGLINELLSAHVNDGMPVPEDTARKLRIQQLEREIEDLENRLKAKRNELERVEQAKAEQEQQQEQARREAVEFVKSIRPNFRTVDNSEIQKKAEEADMTVEELLDEAPDEHQPGDFS